ncbi:hypothetical protein [Nocardia flavorosea]|uniref:hypothetical protein n=1 Tax=Nocardia flavorosea TaxID=53429 RepID=UPI00157BE616|nr:hypothetical protein [Nocardia flavorosea]
MTVWAAPGEPEPSAIVSLFWIATAAVAAPLLSRLLRGLIPDVVPLLGLGVLLGGRRHVFPGRRDSSP